MSQNRSVPKALPEISPSEFARRLEAVSPADLTAAVIERLYIHYCELVRWSRTVSLVGPGTGPEIVERHYGESLAALPLLEPGWRCGVDIGSGAGFPGLVLAAARPDLEFILVESRQRKWSFLMAACRKASLSCRCVNARVDAASIVDLPSSIDLVTVRAVGQGHLALEQLSGRLSPDGGILLWLGTEPPAPPSNFVVDGELRFKGSRSRRIVRLRRRPGEEPAT